MNNSMSTFTSPVALPSSSHSSSTTFLISTLTVTTTLPSSLSVPLPCNYALSQEISRVLADSLPALLSSFREHVGETSEMSSGSFTASNSISAPSSLPSTIHSQSSTPPGTLVFSSFISTYRALRSPAVVFSLPSSTRTTFPPLTFGGLLVGLQCFLPHCPLLERLF